MTRHRRPDQLPAVPDDSAPVAPARRPTWWTVRTVRALAFILVGLAVAMSLASAYVSWRAAAAADERAAAVNQRLETLEADLAERNRRRNAERDAAEARDAATRAELAALLCEVLGQLPDDSPNLDRIRTALACPQPGVQPGAGAPPTASTDTSPPEEAAAPPPRRPSPSPAPPAEEPPSSPPAEPAPEPGLLCTLLPTC